MLSFSPRGVLDEILNLIESVSEDFPSYSCKGKHKHVFIMTRFESRRDTTLYKFKHINNVLDVRTALSSLCDG